MLKYILILSLALSMWATGCSATISEYGYRKNFNSWNTVRWKNIQRQQFDYSCGAAALSTLGKYYFGDPVNEPIVLYILVNQLSPAGLKDRHKNGFSMLDLSFAASKLGYYSAGVVLRPEDIDLLEGPIIVVLNDGMLDHFVVLKGKKGEFVYLADSARGNIRISWWRFLGQWQSRSALILGKPNVGLLKNHGLVINEQLDPEPEVNAYRRSQVKTFSGEI